MDECRKYRKYLSKLNRARKDWANINKDFEDIRMGEGFLNPLDLLMFIDMEIESVEEKLDECW